ncbi:MAG: hypothetical protein LBQ24_01810 [Candidatus Peribacteria bacterium]|jgi:hypothetical protein|nr:hypothetical protein [Candidatus Peribacteria bacterium]
MKNNKIFTSFLFLTFVLAGISYTFATENSFFNKQHNFSGSTLNIEFPKQDEIKTILEKQNNGETLTEEEQSTLDNLNSFKNN